MTTYKIVRFYQSGKESEVMDTGLSLEDAQEHCQDPETSSRTCESHEGVLHTSMHGPWFDGYTEE